MNMAKFNITIDIDWIETDEYGSYSLDSEIKNEIVNSITNKVQENLLTQVENECTKRINEQLTSIERKISDKLNDIMEDFFNTPKDITDKYGDIIKKNVTVTQTLKEACDNFMNQPMDSNGEPTTANAYNVAYKTRTDYIVAKSIDSNMNFKIESAVRDVTNNLKNKISEEIKKQMGDKLAGIINLDDIISGK